MKTTTPLYKIILPVACAFLIAGFNINARAEKGGETLMKLAKSPSVTAPADLQTATAKAHPCPSCTDSWVTVVDNATKGPRHAVNKVVRHNCATCDTTVVTKGIGKSKYNVAMHSCGVSDAAVCCAKN